MKYVWENEFVGLSGFITYPEFDNGQYDFCIDEVIEDIKNGEIEPKFRKDGFFEGISVSTHEAYKNAVVFIDGVRDKKIGPVIVIKGRENSPPTFIEAFNNAVIGTARAGKDKPLVEPKNK
jgi:hypothetical protein